MDEKIDLSSLSQEQVRKVKMEALKKLGVDPFGQKFVRTTNSKEITDLYKDNTKEELIELNKTVKVAGRIMSLRGQGKTAFFHLQDKFGLIQIYLRQDSITENEFNTFKLSDIGDIVGIEGTVMRTNHGELTIKAYKYTFLTKALRPLPEKFHGLQDKEKARRMRYVDLIMNDESKQIALKRPQIIRSLQTFFDERGFVEVETPILQPILGGASARPFVTHHNTLDMPFYLRIATELPLKKLIVGGLEAVYEIGRLFRNEGMDATHNPEFTTVEAYLAYSDMEGMMDLVENCLEYVSLKVNKKTNVIIDNVEINLQKGFKRIHMVDAIKEKTGIDFFKVKSDKEAISLAKEYKIPLQKHEQKFGHVVNLFFEKYVEESLIQPTFVYGHPLEISPLVKKNKIDPRFTDRFELFINKKEYANAYSELNDPLDQKERFLKQLAEREEGNQEANEMDSDFIEALEYGLPPTGGVGIGIDRLVMLLCEVDSIRDILLFPHMRNK